MMYPFHKELQGILRDNPENVTSVNFGLWYNKFIPVDSSCKACDDDGEKKNAVEFYANRYKEHIGSVFFESVEKTLFKKHIDQAAFCNSFSGLYDNIVFKAQLRTPLITGIGESHPNEISMVFDRNTGIPYIPASGIKGIVRFCHTLGLLPEIKDDIEFFDDEAPWTMVPDLFGTQAQKGSVVFLDAYPEKVPDLHVDIMNPHYDEYYREGKAPGDYLDPVVLKFLAVAKGTVFVFRALVEKKKSDLGRRVCEAFKNAFETEGIGAKTAVGYGRFFNVVEKEADSVVDFLKKEDEKKKDEQREEALKAERERKASMTPDDMMLEEISNLKNNTEDISKIAIVIFKAEYGKTVYQALKSKLEELGQWKPDGSKQKKEKMKNRNEMIDNRLL